MMKLLKQLLSIYLFIAVKTATDNDFNNDYNTYTKIRHHSNRGIIDTMRYDVQLIPLINVEDFYDRNIYGRFVSYINDQLEKNFIYYGESTIFFKVKIKTNSIRLNALNMEIEEDATQVIFSSDGINDIIYTPIMQLRDIESETIILYFIDNFVPSYSYRLIIKFVSIITNNTAGFFQMSYINETGGNVNMIAVIDLRVPGAHLAFPCWDQSDFKTNFTISIKFNENYIALSNIPNVEKITDDDIVFTYFNSTDNTSPYIIAFILSDLERVSDENFEQRFIDMWCRPNVVEQLEYALNIAKNISLANLNYDFFAVHSLLDLIVIPDFQDNIMESFRLIFYNEAAIIYTETLDSFAHEMKVACIIARKMVQQFFNSLVDQSWFSPWLYEGLATFLGMQILNEIMPNYYIMELFVIQFQHESLRLNDYYDMPFVSNTDKPSDINSLFVFIRNIKAPVFIHILTQILPANVFTNGLNDYFANLRKFSFFNSLNNVDDTEMFFSVIQKILDDVDSTFDFKTRFSGWITQERYPLLNVTRELSRNMVEIKLSQKCLNISLKNLWIPVFYIILDAPNHVTPLSKYWLTTNKPVLRIADVNRNSWIIVNVQQSGYYRVYYDNHNWENVLKCLHSKHDLIPDLNRAQLINDAYYFLVRGELDFAIFKNLTSYLSHEILYIPWYPMFKIMEEISAFFPFSQSRNIKKHFKLIFENVLEKKLNYEVLTLDNVLTKSLRQEATRWTCILNSSKCMDFATLTLSGHLNKSEPHSLLPWLGKEWTYCSGLMMANDTVWNDVFNTRKTDKKILEFLACTKNHTIIFGYIDRLKSGYFTEIRDYITIFHSIIAKHAKDNLVLDYILEKFIYFRKFILYPSDNNLIVALTDIINHVYSTEQLNKVSDFAKKIIIPEIMTHIHRKIETRMSEIERHINYFENFLKTE